MPGYSSRLALQDRIIPRRLSRSVWREAGAVVALSEDLRQLALETAPELDIRVIPNAADTEMFVPGLANNGFTVLLVGAPHGSERGLKPPGGIREGSRRCSGSRRLVVAEGPEGPRLRANAGRRGLEDPVTFREHVPRDALPPTYRAANVFVLPSVREGMPNVLLEAMASGLPVVTTHPATGLLDKNGAVVAPGDSQELADALLRYAHDPGLQSAHGQRPRELAESLTWDKAATWYVDLYRKIALEPENQAP